MKSYLLLIDPMRRGPLHHKGNTRVSQETGKWGKNMDKSLLVVSAGRQGKAVLELASLTFQEASWGIGTVPTGLVPSLLFLILLEV